MAFSTEQPTRASSRRPLRERLAAGVALLLERSSLGTEAELGRRTGLPSATISRLLAGKDVDVDCLERCLEALGGDLRDLAEAVAEVSGETLRRSTLVSHLTELDHAPRPIDLYQDARRLLIEARRLGGERPSEEADRAVRALGRAVARLGELFDREEAEVSARILDVEAGRLSDEEFDGAMRLLRSLLRRAVAEEKAAGETTGSAEPRPEGESE